MNQTTTVPISGAVKLTFTPNAAGVSSTYMDPALQFINVPSSQATTYTFSVPAGAQTVTIPQIQPGTVAGELTITAFLAGQPITPPSKITIDARPPSIDSTGVQVTNVTSDGFDVEFNAISTPRNLQIATFTFNPATGAKLDGNATFHLDLSSEVTAWYASPASQAYGSRFSLSVPFSFSGSFKAIGSVTVTLTNSAGPSTAVTGTL